MATVAEPVASRRITAVNQASRIGDRFTIWEAWAITAPRPTSISICLRAPPAPMISMMEEMGGSDSPTTLPTARLSLPKKKPGGGGGGAAAGGGAAGGGPGKAES